MKDLIKTHDEMRPIVESILAVAAADFSDIMPTCLSQSYRAHAFLAHLKLLPLSDRAEWFGRASVLEDFIVLNQAIRILEREL